VRIQHPPCILPHKLTCQRQLYCPGLVAQKECWVWQRQFSSLPLQNQCVKTAKHDCDLLQCKFLDTAYGRVSDDRLLSLFFVSSVRKTTRRTATDRRGFAFWLEMFHIFSIPALPWLMRLNVLSFQDAGRQEADNVDWLRELRAHANRWVTCEWQMM